MNFSVQAIAFRSSKEATGDEKKNCVLRRKFFMGFTVCKTGEKFFFLKYIFGSTRNIYIYNKKNFKNKIK